MPSIHPGLSAPTMEQPAARPPFPSPAEVAPLPGLARENPAAATVASPPSPAEANAGAHEAPPVHEQTLPPAPPPEPESRPAPAPEKSAEAIPEPHEEPAPALPVTATKEPLPGGASVPVPAPSSADTPNMPASEERGDDVSEAPQAGQPSDVSSDDPTGHAEADSPMAIDNISAEIDRWLDSVEAPAQSQP